MWYKRALSARFRREKELIFLPMGRLRAYFAGLEALTKCADGGKTGSAQLVARLLRGGTKQCCWQNFSEPKLLQKDKHHRWISL
jgi:hypothetical protein